MDPAQTDTPLTVVRRFLERNPRLAEPARAASQCAIATYGLVDQLNGEGHAAQVVWVRGHVGGCPDAHPRALLADEHAVVRLETGEFIDVTRRQFDPAARFPAIYESSEALARHWEEVNFDPTRRRRWRPTDPTR